MFVGYAPYTDPEIAVATRIAHGYGSSNASVVAAEIMSYYFGEKNVEDIMFLKYLQNFIEQRRQEMPEGSYTTTLFQKGINRMAQKVGEEAVETVIEATNGTDDRLVYEAADMIYHLIVLLTSKGLRIEDLARELKSRHKG